VDEKRGLVIAWSAGASAAAASLAALFSNGSTLVNRILFISFLAVGIVAFLILVSMGFSAGRWYLHNHRDQVTESRRLDDRVDSRKPKKLIQRNVASGHSRVFAALEGNIVIHESGDRAPTAVGESQEEVRSSEDNADNGSNTED
jgi:hypothetical protein